MVRPCLCAHPQIEEQKKIMSSATKTFTTDKGYLSWVAEKQQKFRPATEPGFRPSLTTKLSSSWPMWEIVSIPMQFLHRPVQRLHPPLQALHPEPVSMNPAIE